VDIQTWLNKLNSTRQRAEISPALALGIISLGHGMIYLLFEQFIPHLQIGEQSQYCSTNLALGIVENEAFSLHSS